MLIQKFITVGKQDGQIFDQFYRDCTRSWKNGEFSQR